jgi:Cu(I)/Ag(I) efflux system membrane protein CusA/SilA
VWPARQLGSEFMPELDEGTLLYMPTTLPGISVTKAGELLATQDRIIKSFPEVASVYGKAGRASTATDPAPMEMFETVIALKPKAEWRPGVTLASLRAEMDRALQFPGVSNAWTQPIRARIDMLSTGIRTPVGVKVLGTDLAAMEGVARQVEAVIRAVPGTSSAYAERVIGGYFLDITPDREALGRYGLTVGDVQDVVATALGGQAVTTTVEGRERYTVNVRYPRAFRSDPRAIADDVQVPLPAGGTVPLREVAKVVLTRGPTAIRTENGQLAVYIFVDLAGRDLGGYVAEARQAVADAVRLPQGTTLQWSGQYEYLERAEARLTIVVPLTLLIVFLLLYLNFRRLTETLIVMLSLPFALVGGVWLLWWMGFNLSVAVAVGFIALAGVAAETGVIMLVYLDHAWDEVRARCVHAGRPVTRGDLRRAIMVGAVERVRPKMMTVVAIMAGLLPILWSTGSGSEVMQRIAVPMIGGMVSSTVLTLAVIPAVYGLVKGWGLPPGGESEAAAVDESTPHGAAAAERPPVEPFRETCNAGSALGSDRLAQRLGCSAGRQDHRRIRIGHITFLLLVERQRGGKVRNLPLRQLLGCRDLFLTGLLSRQFAPHDRAGQVQAQGVSRHDNDRERGAGRAETREEFEAVDPRHAHVGQEAIAIQLRHLGKDPTDIGMFTDGEARSLKERCRAGAHGGAVVHQVYERPCPHDVLPITNVALGIE